MASGVPDHLVEKMISQMLATPQLPRQNPTEAFWQLPPHPTISETQSPELRKTIDYAIIGSGVTGCSIAKNLLEHTSLPPDASVTVFEARKLTSGATGRNGGALTSSAGYEFTNLTKHHGREEAIKIAQFFTRTLDKMHELGNSSKEFKEASEVRRLRGVVGFWNEDAFYDAIESFKQYDQAVPGSKARVEVLSPDEALSVSVPKVKIVSPLIYSRDTTSRTSLERWYTAAVHSGHIVWLPEYGHSCLRRMVLDFRSKPTLQSVMLPSNQHQMVTFRTFSPRREGQFAHRKSSMPLTDILGTLCQISEALYSRSEAP